MKKETRVLIFILASWLLTNIFVSACSAQTTANGKAMVKEQQYTIKGATSDTSAMQLTKTASNTATTFTAADGTRYTVWKSSKGSFFIVRKSKKTGNYYKQYLEKQ